LIHHIYVHKNKKKFFLKIFSHLASAGRIFYDPHPQIIQRKGSNSVTYKQNIIVRYLQPPPIPNAGPLVIKEVDLNTKKERNQFCFFFFSSLDKFSTTTSVTSACY